MSELDDTLADASGNAHDHEHDDDALEGCAIDFRDDPTPEDALPPSLGNVEGDADTPSANEMVVGSIVMLHDEPGWLTVEEIDGDIIKCSWTGPRGGRHIQFFAREDLTLVAIPDANAIAADAETEAETDVDTEEHE